MLRSSIYTLLTDQLDMDDDDTVTFSQWTHTDRTTIVARQESVSDFIDILCNQFDKLTSHHFTARSQAAYLSASKESLGEDTVLILLDFAENYSFIVQDSIQGFYWENRQATLHPCGVYYKKDGELSCMSLCVISDCMQHDTVTVHTFLQAILEHIKKELPQVCHVKYFSDGAASQYKNYKNFSNLCYHATDFGLSAEWHFFATSHGKSVCDGIGGTVKRLATRASLQQISTSHILTPEQLFSWAQSNISGIHVFFVPVSDVELNRAKLSARFELSKTIPGTRSHHSFIPVNSCELRISRISGENNSTIVRANDMAPEETATDFHGQQNLQPGQYVAAVYDNSWYLGNVVEVSTEQEDIFLDFMKPKGPAISFSWPRRKDQCWVPRDHILVTTVDLTTATGRQYKLSQEAEKTIFELFEFFLKRHS